jgi:two-component system LytT family response regulator
MNNIKQLYPSFMLSSTGLFSVEHKRYFIGFCAFWIIIAFLEFGQDYISSVLQDTSFQMGESISYKLFWPLFIPFFILLDFGIAKSEKSLSGGLHVFGVILQIIAVTLVHLLVFSMILFGVSILIHDDPVTLMMVIYEKLSTRLYIAFSIYAALSVLTLFVKQRRSQQKNEGVVLSKTKTVKKGTSSVLVDVADIKWISSDGAYLDIYTETQKHVVLDSLKNIIKTLPDNFKRIHKSTIVNIDRIEKLKSRGNGDYDVLLDDNHKLRLSRNYAKSLKGILF